MTLGTDNKEALYVPDDTKDIDTNRVDEKLLMEENATVIERDTIGASGIFDSATNGIFDTSTFDESGRTVTLLRVVSPNNTFRERFRDSYFKESSNTTMNWDTANFRLSLE